MPPQPVCPAPESSLRRLSALCASARNYSCNCLVSRKRSCAFIFRIARDRRNPNPIAKSCISRTSKGTRQQPLCFPHFRDPLGSADSKGLTAPKFLLQVLYNLHLRTPSGSAGNKELITPVESALTENHSVTPLESALAKNPREGIAFRSSTSFTSSTSSTFSQTHCLLTPLRRYFFISLFPFFPNRKQTRLRRGRIRNRLQLRELLPQRLRNYSIHTLRTRSGLFVVCVSRTRDCRVPFALVCFGHDAVQRTTPRRPPLLQEVLQVHP